MDNGMSSGSHNLAKRDWRLAYKVSCQVNTTTTIIINYLCKLHAVNVLFNIDSINKRLVWIHYAERN